MLLTHKLSRYLYRSFGRAPNAAPAIRLAGSAAMRVVLDNAVLTLSGGTASYTLNLSTSQTLQDVVDGINQANAGYTASLEAIGNGDLGALALLDVTGQGDAVLLQHYRAVHWMLLDVFATELYAVKTSSTAMLRQIFIDTAEGEWLDYWLRYTIGGGRKNGEDDTSLRARIIATILRKKCNNYAIEDIVKAATGISITVEDIPWRNADGTVNEAVCARYSLYRRLANGWPAWGAPANNNPVQCAFAVIFAAGATCGQRKRVLDIIHQVKAAGTMPLTYREGRMLRTNVADELTNHPYWLTGPMTANYAPWDCAA